MYIIRVVKGTPHTMIKTLLSVLALTSLTTPVLAQSNMAQHQQLWNAVESTGVDIRVNENKDCNPDYNNGKTFYGWYHGPKRALVVCQEVALDSGVYGRGQGEWSEEDLDTLRHEAHHLVQDCMDDVLDQELVPVYTKPLDLALDILGKEGALGVVRSYKDSSEHVQVLELEAFSVAEMNDPQEQVRDIKKYCF